METRKCPKCGKVFIASGEYFNIKRDGSLTKMCSSCRAKKNLIEKKFRKTEKGKACTAKAQQRAKAQRLLNRELSQPRILKNKENGYQKCYVCQKLYLFNSDNFMIKDSKLITRCRNCTDDSDSYIKHLEKNKKYKNNHPEKRKASKKKYQSSERGRQKLREFERIKGQRRRARKNRLESSLTTKQWEDAKSFFNGCCAYCGKEEAMTQDHFIAVSNGGEYSRDNVLPVCFSCNSSKSNKDFFEWYPQQEFYSKMREKRILKYLNYKANGVQQRTLLG